MAAKQFYTVLIILFVFLGCENKKLETNIEGKEDARTDSLTDAEIVQLHNRATGQMGQFNYDAAVACYEELLKTAENSDRHKIDLGIALLNRRLENDLSVAAKLFEGISESSPENLRAEYCRALLLFHEGKTEEANELFQNVAASDQDDSYAVFYVGQTEFMLGNFAKALELFEKSAEIDPYLRSAYYGAFQAAQRLRESDKASGFLRAFQRLENNPRARLAELKYTRMGPKAEVSRSHSDTRSLKQPEGFIFADPTLLAIQGIDKIDWATANEKYAPNITIADINDDGRADIFISGVVQSEGNTLSNIVLLATDDGFRRDADSQLEDIQEVNTALWGDYDDDGLTDVYLCRTGPNQLWRQAIAGQWENVTTKTKTSAGDSVTVDGACYDADHDGDLDYLLVNSDAPCELLNNNRDGTFRPLAKEVGIAVDHRAERLVIADLDTDDDADLIFLNQKPPHDVFLNDRLWEYHSAEGFEEFRKTAIAAAVAVDADVDGQVELYTYGKTGLQRWNPNQEGQWYSEVLVEPDGAGNDHSSSLILQDFDGDTALEIALHTGTEVRLFELDGSELDTLHHDKLIGPPAALLHVSGPELIGTTSDGPPLIWAAGSGRYDFALLSLSGKTDKAAEMRSNSSGIGVRGAARIGERWSPISPWRLQSGPGQGLQPHSIGLAGADQIDYVQLVWPDGVSQTEVDLRAGELHRISETQRQAGSCPLIFVWDGEKYQFMADILGGGGIGFNLGKGEYYPPRPSESFMLSSDQIDVRNGRIEIKLGEPMEEICYFDAVRLFSVDIPADWNMVLDERFGGSDPQPTGEPVFFREAHTPELAINDRGEDITAHLSEVDRLAAPLGRTDRRFVGLTNPYELVLRFAEPLDELENPILVFDGWVEYAYSQTAFAAWQAGLTYLEPTVEARNKNGTWKVVLDRFGYMAGTPRRSSVPIPKEELPSGTTELRISSNMQIYWDCISIVDAMPPKNVSKTQLLLETALVQDAGFSQRDLLDQRYPIYDYQNRPPFGSARHPRGFYTAFGDARKLVTHTDDAVAIIGPGEEIHLEFAEHDEDPQPGRSRFYILEVDGWCKDSDSFTRDSRRVEPLPNRGITLSEEESYHRRKLHSEYNTRYRSGW